MTAFPVLMGIFAILMLGMVLVTAVLVVGAALVGSRRRAGQGQRIPAPGEMDVMTDSLHPGAMGHLHGMEGAAAADRLIATGIAVDALAASQAGGHGHSAGQHNAGMHHGQDMSPPVHHDPGPTTMPTTMPDMPSHHHG